MERSQPLLAVVLTTSLSLFIFAQVFLVGSVAGSVGCKDENGKAVDWWIILKYPYLPKSADPSAKSGFGYSYCDVNSQSLNYTGLQLDKNLDGSLGSTISQVYSAKSSTTAWIFYDDEAPDNEQSFGHTKGVLAFDKTSGFWLVHSVPRFPLKAPYNFPDNEKQYGQSFLCVTYPTSTFDTIGKQLQINDPYVFKSNLPSSLASKVPHIQEVLNQNFTKGVAAQSMVQLQSKGGDLFYSFAKNAASNMNLYEDFVEPSLQTGLKVETWMNGPNDEKMPTMCPPKSQYDSINVRQVSISGDITWPETKDHSKWAVSIDVNGIYCIRDINRQFSQSARGGGTICANNTNIWNSFTGIVTTADSCS